MSRRLTHRIVTLSLALALAAPGALLAGPGGGAHLVKDYRKALSAARGDEVQTVRVHLEFAVKATEAAREENNPNYMGFTGGADNVQYLQEAKKVLDALTAQKGATDPEVVALTREYESSHEKVAAICDAFTRSKLENEAPPVDVYKGSDRKDLETRILAEWAKLYPKDEVLGLRFHMASWQRNQEHQWQEATKSWRDVDMSVLAVSVIVKTGDTVATVYPAYANKDHLSGDALTIGVKTKSSEYVHREVLLSKL